MAPSYLLHGREMVAPSLCALASSHLCVERLPSGSAAQPDPTPTKPVSRVPPLCVSAPPRLCVETPLGTRSRLPCVGHPFPRPRDLRPFVAHSRLAIPLPEVWNRGGTPLLPPLPLVTPLLCGFRALCGEPSLQGSYGHSGCTTNNTKLLALPPLASLRLCVRKQFNEAWAVYPLPFSVPSVSLW